MKRVLSVTVVIPTLSRYDLLKESLESILCQSYLPDEVVVVDNGVNSCGCDELRDKFGTNPSIKFIQQAEKSIPLARNRGLREAKSDVVIFTDDDCIFSNDWINNMIQPFINDASIGIVGGEIFTRAHSNSPVDNYFVDMKMGRVGAAPDIKWKKVYVPGELSIGNGFTIQPFFTGANMAVRKSVACAIGGFDTHFKTNEDLEFCIRAAKNGWKLYFQPNAIVTHKPSRTFNHILQSWYNYGIYHGPLFKKYNNKTAEIYIYKSWCKGSYPNFLQFVLKAPFNAVIFVNSFHLMNISFILAVMSKILHYNYFFTAFMSVFLLSLLRYLWLRTRTMRPSQMFFYLVINYLLNLSYCFGAFVGGLRAGMFYLEATVDEAR